MKNNKTTLTKEDFSFVCPLKKEDMSTIEGGYFCQKCDKKVHDITNMNQDDFQTLKATNANICVSIQKVAVVSLILGLSACTKPTPEHRLLDKIAPNVSCDANITKPPKENRLAPFTPIDKKQSIYINRATEPQLAGKMMPLNIQKKVLKEKKK